MENKRKNNEKAKLFTTSTSSSDIALFKALGLKTFTEIQSGIDYFVGEAGFTDGSKVKIWIHPMPAQFWRFEIYISSPKRTIVISTGSGPMINFWSTVKLFAENMLEVKYK